MIIHAEGGTTNGKLIKFKKGAFASLRSIRPRAIQYNSLLGVTPRSGILDGLKLYVLVSVMLPSYIQVYDMPIFRPNDYFWKHHQKEGESQWQTYARVIRDIIAEAGGFEKTEQWVEEKFEYMENLWPKKSKKKDTSAPQKKD